MSIAAWVLSATVLAASVPVQAMPEDTEIMTTESGLKYSILESGNGRKPERSDFVELHLQAWSESGEIFENTRQRGQAIPIKVSSLGSEGLREGLTLVDEGGSIKLTVPPDLVDSRPDHIPEDQNLVFQVELLKIFDLPEFPGLDEEQAKTTGSGLRYEILEAGEGPAPDADESVIFNYLIWTPEGVALDSSYVAGRPIKGPPSQLPLDFMGEASTLMTEGSSILFEVPPALAFGDQEFGELLANSVSYWQLDSVKKPVPPKIAEEAWKSTDSGLKYVVHSETEGEKPELGDVVEVYYTGWLTDGTMFDTTAGGKPAKFQLGSVIAGWNEGLALMSEGSKATFYIPFAQAYGEQGRPPVIPPSSDLIFTVELISFDDE